MAPHTVLESFVIGALAAAWADLVAQDQQRGGSGRLRDPAITLTRRRTVITVHSDYHDEARTLSARLTLSPPLPRRMCELLFESLMHEWPRAGRLRQSCLCLNGG